MALLKGVCHPGDPLEVKECGFEWVRMGCPFAYNQQGELSERYLMYKERCRQYKEVGLKIMTISPGPMEFCSRGIKGEAISDVVEFIVRDMEGLVDGWQIANELNVYFFRAPLGFDDAIEFIARGLEGAHRANKDILLGYNFSEYSESSIYMMNKLLPYKHLYNYIGYDGYYGTWIQGRPQDFITAIDEIHKLTGEKVLVQEFGFASIGEKETPGELDRLMNKYGFKDFEHAKANCEQFLEMISPHLSAHIKSVPRNEWETNLLHLKQHLLKKWDTGDDDFPHDEDGQARFYEELLPKLMAHPHVIGFMVFRWKDGGACFFCREIDCPCETAWGLINNDGTRKKAYHVVKKYIKGD